MSVRFFTPYTCIKAMDPSDLSPEFSLLIVFESIHPDIAHDYCPREPNAPFDRKYQSEPFLSQQILRA